MLNLTARYRIAYVKNKILLIHQETFNLAPSSPFDFDSTFHKPDHFPSPDNLWQPGTRWQTYFWQDQQIGLKFENTGSGQKPKITTTVFSQLDLPSQFLDSLKDEITYRYNLSMDLTDFYSLFKADPILKTSLEKFEGMRSGHAGSLYEYIIIGIVLQNTTVKRSVQMLENLFQNYGALLNFDGKDLWAFWAPGQPSRNQRRGFKKAQTWLQSKINKKNRRSL